MRFSCLARVLCLLALTISCADTDPADPEVPIDPVPSELVGIGGSVDAGPTPAQSSQGSCAPIVGSDVVDASTCAAPSPVILAPEPAIVVANPLPQPEGCPCTRRPQALPNYRCPWGVGSSNTAAFGAEGGTVQLGGTLATVGVSQLFRIPRGALSQCTQVTLTELKTAPPVEYIDFSPIYRVEPLGLALAVPGEMRIGHSHGNWSSTGTESVGIFRADAVEGPYVRVPDSYLNAGFTQATFMRGGYYFAGYLKPEALRHCL